MQESRIIQETAQFSGPSPNWYQGQPLGSKPHVLVVFRDQIGDFVVATPLLRGLRERYPDLILDYLGGERTRELEEASRLIDARFSLFPSSPAKEEPAPSLLEEDSLRRFLAQRREIAGPYALAINLESDPAAAHAVRLCDARLMVGACQAPNGRSLLPPPLGIDRLWHDVWNRPDLMNDYPVLTSHYIGEIFARLARVETDYTHTEVPMAQPPAPVPPALFATGGGRSAKLWEIPYWIEVADWCHRNGLSLGLLGAAPRLQAEAYYAADVDDLLVAAGVADLRGQLTLPQVAGALARARAFLTVDSGLLHMAAAVRAPTVALFGASPQRLWAPPVPWVTVLEPYEPCSLCEENRFRNEACLLPVHQCMRSISPARVAAELSRLLS